MIFINAQAQAKGIQFSVSQPKNVSLKIDRGQMTQALLNILQNALDAAPRGGTITIASSLTDQKVLLKITDSGEGMTADQLNHIFNLYYTTKPTGSGLGLAITRQIIELHGGSIDVSSKEGKGTTVVLSVPL